MDYGQMKHPRDYKMKCALIGKKVAKIIAIQGNPHTGKTTIANSLAQRLKCPVIHFDEILDIISPHRPPNSDKAETLMSQAFDLIAYIVTSQTSTGQSVIVDSPLSRRSHLDKLLALDFDENSCPIINNEGMYYTDDQKEIVRRLVIVECKPTVPYVWETRFKARDSSIPQWYKPHEWPCGAEFARDYTDNDVRSMVSKVVVDTTNDVARLDDLAQSLDYLANVNKGGMVDLANDTELAVGRKKAHYSIMYFMMIDNLVHWPNITVICLICEKKFNHRRDWVSFTRSMGKFGCPSEALAIHKSCAELGSGVGGGLGHYRTFTPKQFPKFFEEKSGVTEFCFPEEHRCTSSTCPPHRSNRIDSCLFDSHLKSKLVPPIVNHKGHDKGHLLCFWFSKTSSNITKYSCAACWESGDYLGYGCLSNCGVDYHAECALLPTVVQKHKHGGYTHDLEMVFCREKELEEYICSLCDKEMNPKAWYYCCHDCQLEFHLPCAFQDFIPQ